MTKVALALERWHQTHFRLRQVTLERVPRPVRPQSGRLVLTLGRRASRWHGRNRIRKSNSDSIVLHIIHTAVASQGSNCLTLGACPHLRLPPRVVSQSQSDEFLALPKNLFLQLPAGKPGRTWILDFSARGPSFNSPSPNFPKSCPSFTTAHHFPPPPIHL